ncbi:MAG TPA: MMPL family transporter [Actinomycetota bacterium]|jgi:RND superfamily putative drug exporter
MLTRLGRAAVEHRRLILIVSLVGFVLAGVFGGNVATKLSTAGFDDPNAESTLADDTLEAEFGSGQANLILLVTAKSGSVDDDAAAAAGQALTEELQAEPTIAQAFSYWSLGSPPPLKSGDGSQALVLARIAGDEDAVDERVEHIAPKYTRGDDTITVGVGSIAQIFNQVGTQIESDLRKAELITFPIVLIMLVLVFGSVVAAGLPLAVGALSVIGTFLVLRVLTLFTPVSIYSINLTTAMGLGLAIDYSLFIVSRYREEVRAGKESTEAIVRTVETAGRTVIFSALTVAISLAALLVFPLYFLRSFAYAGIAVVGIAMIGAVVFLPALLAVLGPRVDKWVLWHHKPKDVGEGFWHRLAVVVMRRPLAITVAVVALMLFLGAPFLNVRFGLPDDRVLPESATGRQVQDEIRTNFSSAEASALTVVAPGVDRPAERRDEIESYAEALSQVDGVARVDALTGSYLAGQQVAEPGAASVRFAAEDATWLSVVPSVEPMSAEGESLVEDVRDVAAPFEVSVGGPSAQLVDSKESIFGKVPLAGLLIAVVTFTLLFLMTGSVLVPVKALVLNLLSLSATFGAMVWIFQEGHFADTLGFTATGTLDTTTPILMFCVAFGLSMDYEVFLLSRIKEEYDLTGDNARSVATGLERTGRIVTAAAALLAIVFVATATSAISFIKLFGVGLTLAVIMDATLIRGTLVPAFMKLAGRANWWAPGPLRRFHERWGISDAETPAAAPAQGGGS